MIIDYHVKKKIIEPLTINSGVVEVVNNYKYLGTIIDYKLKGNDNTSRFYKKAH